MRPFAERILNSLSREDMRASPVSAIAKRLWWKLRWMVRKDDWLLTLDNGMHLTAPHSGAAALIYYLGTSEPATTALLSRYLRPGMVVLDIGAHIGEYTIRASELVGASGQVHAFEPNPVMFRYLERNAARSPLDNIIVQQAAVADKQGKMEFAIQSEPSISSLVPGADQLARAPVQTIAVPVQTLDAYCVEYGLEQVDFIKIDIEGAELLAFKGAKSLLSQAAGIAPAIYFEFTERLMRPFGYRSADVLEYLVAHGYTVFDCPDGETLIEVDCASGQAPISPNLLATKRGTSTG